MAEAAGKLELEKTPWRDAWDYVTSKIPTDIAVDLFPAFSTSYGLAQRRGEFGVFARRQMPVLEEGDIIKIRNKIAAVDWVQVDMGRMLLDNPGILTPTQSQIYVDKVIDYIANGVTVLAANPNPILVSKNLHIIDGHHRWLGAMLMAQTVPTIEIDLPTRQLLKLALHLSNQEGHERNG